MPEKIATVPTGPKDETPISGVTTENPDFFCLLTEAGSQGGGQARGPEPYLCGRWRR